MCVACARFHGAQACGALVESVCADYRLVSALRVFHAAVPYVGFFYFPVDYPAVFYFSFGLQFSEVCAVSQYFADSRAGEVVACSLFDAGRLELAQYVIYLCALRVSVEYEAHDLRLARVRA